MTIEKIRYFVEVARTGSITHAAKNLYISQPNLSKQIAQLEAECGIELFSRARHRLELTEAGAELYEHIQDVPGIVEEAFARARACSLRKTRRLSIGVMELQAMNEMLMPAIATLTQRHPGVDVNLARAGFGKLRAGLYSGDYDLIVTMCFDADHVPEFEKMVLNEPIPMIAVHKDTALARRSSVSFGELSREPFVLISSGETPRGEEQFLSECAKFGFEPRLVRRPSSLESLLLCVEAGIGIALLDNNIQLDPGTPVRLIPVKDIPSMSFSAVWRKSGENELLREFVEILRSLD